MSPLRALIHTVGSFLSSTGLTVEQQNLKQMLCNTPKIDYNQPLHKLRFVVLDTETTGFKPCNGDRVISLGAVIVENGKINEEKTFYELVDPGRDIPAEITALTGITQQMVHDKPSLAEVLNRFISWSGESIFVGHVVRFDLAFLNVYLSRNCGAKLKHRYIDTKDLAASLYSGLNNFSLESLCSHLKITCEQRHHALGDAISAARILETCIERLSQQGIYTLLDLHSRIRYYQLMMPASTPICS